MLNMNMKYPNFAITEVLKRVRGFFPRELYVGGSYGRSLALGGDYNDIDIFVLMSRNFERWALIEILEIIFDRVEESEREDDYEYRIPNQWGFFRCYVGVDQYDIIFVDASIGDLVETGTDSDLSRFYYKVEYGPESAVNVDECFALSLYRGGIVSDVLGHLEDGECHIDVGRATKQHVDKMRAACRGYGLRVVECNEPIVSDPFEQLLILDEDDIWGL